MDDNEKRKLRKLKKIAGASEKKAKLNLVIIIILAMIIIWFVINSDESILMKIPFMKYFIVGGNSGEGREGDAGDVSERFAESKQYDNRAAIDEYYKNELQARSKSNMNVKESRNRQYVPNASWLVPEIDRSDAAFDKRPVRHFGRFNKEVDSDAIAGEWNVPMRELDNETAYLHGGDDYF